MLDHVVAPGQILSGKYRLEEEIGRGGMGSVWRSTRMDLGTSLALKLMHGLASDNPSGFDRLSREAKAAASLSSPHVVRVIDFGVDAAENVTFIAMELLEGESLAQRLERRGRLSLPVIASVITQVARALSQAHGAGIIHRDLKPANIFLVQNGDDELVKLLDFGVAKAVGALGGGVATVTGHVLGTPYYMSPEQVNASRDIDPRTDIWSLGVIVSECLTGRRPFTADTLSELAMKISLGRAEVPSSVAAVPAAFDAWFARATAVDPARRFQSVIELAQELRALAERSRERAGDFSGIALASTQRAESSALGLGAHITERLEITAASERRGSTDAALSTTAQGSALSSSGPQFARSRGSRGRAPRLGVFALLGVGALGGLLSWKLRPSAQPPRPMTAVLESPAAMAEPKLAVPATTAPVMAAPVTVTPVTVTPVVTEALVPAHAATPATNSIPKQARATKDRRRAAVNAAKAAANPAQRRLDAYDIP